MFRFEVYLDGEDTPRVKVNKIDRALRHALRLRREHKVGTTVLDTETGQRHPYTAPIVHNPPG